MTSKHVLYINELNNNYKMLNDILKVYLKYEKYDIKSIIKIANDILAITKKINIDNINDTSRLDFYETSIDLINSFLYKTKKFSDIDIRTISNIKLAISYLIIFIEENIYDLYVSSDKSIDEWYIYYTKERNDEDIKNKKWIF